MWLSGWTWLLVGDGWYWDLVLEVSSVCEVSKMGPG